MVQRTATTASAMPNDGCCELNGSGEVAPGLVVVWGDWTKLLEPSEEVLDQVPYFEEVEIAPADLLVGSQPPKADRLGIEDRAAPESAIRAG